MTSMQQFETALSQQFVNAKVVENTFEGVETTLENLTTHAVSVQVEVFAGKVGNVQMSIASVTHELDIADETCPTKVVSADIGVWPSNDDLATLDIFDDHWTLLGEHVEAGDWAEALASVLAYVVADIEQYMANRSLDAI